MTTNHETFSGEQVIITMPTRDDRKYKYRHQDGRELEYYRNNYGVDSYIPEYRLIGSDELERKSRVQFLIDNKEEYHEFVRLRNKFGQLLEEINDYTKEEYERLHNDN